MNLEDIDAIVFDFDGVLTSNLAYLKRVSCLLKN